MKRVLMLLVIVLLAGSCKDEELFGSIVLPMNPGAQVNGTPVIGLQVYLYDFTSNLSSGDVLMTATITASGAQFKEVNPGNYKVTVMGVQSTYKSVQVKAGKEVTVYLF